MYIYIHIYVICSYYISGRYLDIYEIRIIYRFTLHPPMKGRHTTLRNYRIYDMQIVFFCYHPTLRSHPLIPPYIKALFNTVGGGIPGLYDNLP